MHIGDWSSDGCSSDLALGHRFRMGGGSGAVDDALLDPLHDPGEADEIIGAILVHVGHAVAAGGGAITLDHLVEQIGRTTCRESVCHYVSISGVDVSVKKKYTIK